MNFCQGSVSLRSIFGSLVLVRYLTPMGLFQPYWMCFITATLYLCSTWVCVCVWICVPVVTMPLKLCPMLFTDFLKPLQLQVTSNINPSQPTAGVKWSHLSNVIMLPL